MEEVRGKQGINELNEIVRSRSGGQLDIYSLAIDV